MAWHDLWLKEILLRSLFLLLVFFNTHLAGCCSLLLQLACFNSYIILISYNMQKAFIAVANVSNFMQQHEWAVGILLGLRFKEWNSTVFFICFQCKKEVIKKFSAIVRDLQILYKTGRQLSLFCNKENSFNIRDGPYLNII